MSSQSSQGRKQNRKANLPLIIAGIVLIVIGASIALVSTAEWELPFTPSDPDPRNPPPENGGSGTSVPTTTEYPPITYTWTTTPATEFHPSASVRIIGVDGNVLKTYKLFAVWKMGEEKVAYIEVPFNVYLGIYAPVGGSATAVVEQARVQTILYIKIRHEGIGEAMEAHIIQALMDAVMSKDSEKSSLLDYKVISEDEVMGVFKKEKVVVGSWSGSFYFIPDTVFSDLYEVMGDKAFGTYEISIAMKVILPEKSLGMSSSWVTITLKAEPYPDTGGGGGGGEPNPPGGKPPIEPISVVWEP